MQTSAPELIDLSRGVAGDARPVRRRAGQAVASPTTACWPAGWSSAACASSSSTTPTGTTTAARARTSTKRPRPASAARSTRPCAALVTDLKRRGLLDDTLVDLGRRVRPHADGRDPRARSAATTTSTPTPCGWPAAASSRASSSARPTSSASPPSRTAVHVHDLQATILHLLGLDHTKLTFRFQGRDFRLTDVHGNVVHELLS